MFNKISTESPDECITKLETRRGILICVSAIYSIHVCIIDHIQQKFAMIYYLPLIIHWLNI